jgi:hypothetical protein
MRHVFPKTSVICLFKYFTVENNIQLQYAHLSLHELIEVIHADYYDSLSRSCRIIKVYIENVSSASLSSDDVANIKISEDIIISVADYIDQRTSVLVPYILELVQKDTAGHNCSTCSGKCSLQHNTRLMEFQMQLSQLKEHINPLIETSQQIYKTTNHEYLLMINDEMDLIGRRVQELLLIEEDCLVPKIGVVQKNINAI